MNELRGLLNTAQNKIIELKDTSASRDSKVLLLENFENQREDPNWESTSVPCWSIISGKTLVNLYVASVAIASMPPASTMSRGHNRRLGLASPNHSNNRQAETQVCVIRCLCFCIQWSSYCGNCVGDFRCLVS